MDLSLHGLVEAQAARAPEAIAVVAEDGPLTYAGLEARARALAGQLADHRVGPADLVAIVLDRSADLVVAMLAVLKAGAGFLPLDTSYPAERIGYAIEDARPALVLTDPGSGCRVPDTARRLLTGEWRGAGSQSGPPGRTVLPDETAYVIYTSGSTGRPKGVVITHRSIVNYVTWQLREYPLTPDDRFLQKAPVGFDGAVLEFFLPLCAGAAVVLARPDGHREPEYIAELIAAQQITLAQFVPSMLPVFLDDSLAQLCTSLRRVYSASDALPIAVQQRFRQCLSAELVNLYGPTEATVDAAHWRCVPEPGAVSVPVGNAVENMRADVLDARLRRAEPLAAGEIYLAGIQLARGYLGRPGLTAERLLADPYGAPGERMYRTGDLGRKRADGVLEFIGRADSQVKIGGVRVEPAEIEAALADHPGVRLAAAKAVAAPSGERRIAAYVVAEYPRSVTSEEIREYLRGRLPEAAVPAYVEFLDDLPRTPNEKLDRAALPVPGCAGSGDAPDEDQEYADETEQVFLTLIRAVLGVRRAAPADSFIGLGGDSISAMHLASRARQAGLGITTGDVLRHKTLGQLLDAARTGSRAAAAEDLEGIGAFPPTPIMHWLREQGGPIDSFSQSMVVRTPAGARPETLLACLQAVLDRHDMLRATFRAAGPGSGWRPEVLAVGTVSAADCLETVDAAEVADAGRPALIRAGLQRARSRLSVSAPRMLAAIWYPGRPGRQGRLAVLVNHLAIDGVSLRVLQADLAQAWRTLGQTGTPRLDPVPVSFRRWARLLGQEAHSPRRRTELSHWLGAAGGRVVPVARRVIDQQTDTLGTARTRRFDLPPDQTEALLSRAPAALGAEVNTLLVAGLVLALAEWRAPAAHFIDRDFLIAMEGHGREPVFPGVDPDRTVGWFTTLFPVRLGLDGIEARAADRDPAALRRAVDRIGAQLAAIPDKGIGFGLLRYLNPDTAGRLAGQGDRPELLFNYLGRFAESDGSDWAFDTEHDVGRDEADQAMPLAFAVEVNCLTMPRADGQALSAIWQWADSLVDGRALGALAELWFARLADLARLADQVDPTKPAARPGRASTPAGASDIESDFRSF